MGRKADPAPKAEPVNLNRAALAADSAALTQVSARSMEIAERFGDGEPYDRRTVIARARFHAGVSAEAMLEFGKCLIQLKENEPHGEFCEIVTEQLGIGMRSAQLMMQAAAKYLSPALASKAKSVSLLGKSKLFDLMAEPDDAIEALADGGTLAGKTLDEMQSMTRKELQDALQEERKRSAAKDKVIEGKDKKLNKLAEEAAARQNATMEEAEAFQIEDLRAATLDAEGSLLRLLTIVDEVIAAPATEASETCARHSLDYLVQRVVDACQARALAVDLADRVSPIWVKPIDDAATADSKTRKAKR